MNGLVITTVLITVGGAEAKSFVTGKGPTFHPVLSGFIVGLFLLVIGMTSQNLGQKLCYLVIAFSLITNGASIATTLANANTRTGNLAPVAPSGGATLLSRGRGAINLKG